MSQTELETELKFQKQKVERLEDEVSRMIRRAQVSEVEVVRLKAEISQMIQKARLTEIEIKQLKQNLK